jgi:hypothetical protein
MRSFINLYYKPSIIRMTKSRRMRWAGHVARMGKWRNAHRISVGKPEGKRKIHNEELHNLYYTPSIIRMTKSRRMRWARHVARMGKKRNAHRISVGEPEGKTPLGRPRRRWVNKVETDLR